MHVYVPIGSVVLAGAHELGTGDAARVTNADALALVAGDGGAEILVWATA